MTWFESRKQRADRELAQWCRTHRLIIAGSKGSGPGLDMSLDMLRLTMKYGGPPTTDRTQLGPGAYIEPDPTAPITTTARGLVRLLGTIHPKRSDRRILEATRASMLGNPKKNPRRS